MTNTNESGRSMVEMLGVLAIIGVLSVMGIAGYTQAMRRYKANEAVAAISMAAVVCGTGTSQTVSNFDKPGIVTGLECSGNGVSYQLAQTGIDKDAVESLLASSGGKLANGVYTAVS